MVCIPRLETGINNVCMLGQKHIISYINPDRVNGRVTSKHLHFSVDIGSTALTNDYSSEL